MKFVGAHVSASGGVFNAPLNAKALNAKAFALFTKNQKRWEAKPLDTKTIDLFKKNLEEHRNFLLTLLEDIQYYSTLSIRTLKKIRDWYKILNDEKKLRKAIKDLQSFLGEDYLEKEKRKIAKTTREVILAVYNKKE